MTRSRNPLIRARWIARHLARAGLAVYRRGLWTSIMAPYIGVTVTADPWPWSATGGSALIITSAQSGCRWRQCGAWTAGAQAP